MRTTARLATSVSMFRVELKGITGQRDPLDRWTGRAWSNDLLLYLEIMRNEKCCIY